MNLSIKRWGLIAALGLIASSSAGVDAADFDPTAETLKFVKNLKVGAKDWPQWGGSPHRNNTPDAKNIPTEWNVETGKNIKWAARLGSQTYGNPVVANGKVYVGTNNGAGYSKRYPSNVDLGCLVCFDEKTGAQLWQHSSPKLPTGRVHDWPLQGICCSPLVDGERLWFVTSRGEVRCLDTEGFHDSENDGSYTAEGSSDKDEADVIWVFDMMSRLGTSQHNMCSCSVTVWGDILLVNTSNGVDESHINIPAPDAASFIALDKNTGELLWTDNSPGRNIVHGQWSSPTCFESNGQAQAVYCGGDGWVYSFDPKGDGNGKAKLLWKMDCNPKEAKAILGGRGTRNEGIGTPIYYDGYVYLAVGQDPEHGEGISHFWCIDPNKRGDVSPTLAQDKDGQPIPHRRLQAVEPEKGEKAVPNPNSAVYWRYSHSDRNGNKKIEFEETFHRTIGTAAARNGLVFIADFSGLFHCVSAKEVDKSQPNEDGTFPPKVFWAYDMFAASWGSPLLVEDRVYIGDEDGDVAIFKLSADPEVAMPGGSPIAEINVGNAVYSSPIAANDTLFIANKSTLFAIQNGAQSKPAEQE